MKSRMTETPFEVDGIMYSNGTFSVKYHSVGPEDPNFTYRNIEIFWGNDMDDGFTIKSTEKLSLHEIVKMMDDCCSDSVIHHFLTLSASRSRSKKGGGMHLITKSRTLICRSSLDSSFFC